MSLNIYIIAEYNMSRLLLIKTKNNMANTSKTARKTAKIVKPLYAVSALTKNSSANLWVVFPAGSTSRGLVYSSTLSRDTVRNAARKAWGITDISNVRSRRVKSYRKFTK